MNNERSSLLMSGTSFFTNSLLQEVPLKGSTKGILGHLKLLLLTAFQEKLFSTLMPIQALPFESMRVQAYVPTLMSSQHDSTVLLHQGIELLFQRFGLPSVAQ